MQQVFCSGSIGKMEGGMGKGGREVRRRGRGEGVTKRHIHKFGRGARCAPQICMSISHTNRAPPVPPHFPRADYDMLARVRSRRRGGGGSRRGGGRPRA
eukprot:COSAG02_NODE_4984_length_4750_cov_5.407224_6_plen_99_part_00